MKISINQISFNIVKNIIKNSDKLQLKVKTGALDCTIIDLNDCWEKLDSNLKR